MFTRLRAAYGVVKDSGAVEAITRGPGGFLQVMAFLWFCASVLVLWFPPGGFSGGWPEAGAVLGPPGLCIAFMVCSVLHVVLLVVTKQRRTTPGLGDAKEPAPETGPSLSSGP